MTAAVGALGVEPVDAPPIPGLAFRTATPADWDAMARIQNAARRADGLEEVRTGESLAAEWGPFDAFELERDLLFAEVDGEPVGYTLGLIQERDGSLVAESHGSIHPGHRRRGIGTALLRTSRRRLAAELGADPRPGSRELRAYAMEVEVGSVALLEAEGYVPIRFGFEMRRFLTGAIPEHPMPDGLELRPVTPDQHRAIFAADGEAFADHWGHREHTEGDFVRLFQGPETDPTLWSVGWDGDEAIGSVMTAVYDDQNAQLGTSHGWLEHVSVRRAWRGRGVAKALIADAFARLKARGIEEAWLGVDGSNPTGALQLYEGLGFRSVRRWMAFGRPVDRPAEPGWNTGGTHRSASEA